MLFVSLNSRSEVRQDLVTCHPYNAQLYGVQDFAEATWGSGFRVQGSELGV